MPQLIRHRARHYTAHSPAAFAAAVSIAGRDTSRGDGRNGHTRTTDGRIDLELAVPKEMGGSGGGANPEQLFTAGYAACFHSALRLVGSQAKRNVNDSAVGAKVGIRIVDGGGFGPTVVLEVTLPDLPEDEAQAPADRGA